MTQLTFNHILPSTPNELFEKKTFKIKIYTYEQSSETNIKIHIFLNIKSVLKTNQIISHS